MPSHYTKPRSQSPSKRWTTTMRSSLEEVAAQLNAGEQREQAVKDMRERKIANTKTSISFGNDRVSYLSDAMESMHRCQGSYTPEERAQQQKRIKDMKAELTTTNFRLGDEVPSYVSVNRESMAIAERFRDVERVSMNTGLKEAVKKSSIHFGNERVVYETVAHEAMKYRGNENNFSKLKEEVQEMTTTLRRHNFTFGDEKVLYESDYQRGYGSISSDAYASMANRKKGMRAIIEDSRACHFSLGNDRPQYLSNTHAALKTIESHSATDVTAQIERAKAMKAALQKTSFIIGDDEEYF